ncbi:MAG: prephenate dehydrogenase, partial [Anaerolineae bacterium]
VVGLGLMDGSLALRLKGNRLCRRVVGLARRPTTAAQAESLGAVDWATTDPARALQQADIVVFCTPVRALVRQLHACAPHFKPGAIITDMGSTKQRIVRAMEALPPHVYPVGSHPMCGKEVSGLAAAEASLFEGAAWVISPLTRTPEGVAAVVGDLARAVGARPLELAPARHDRLAAAISHAPYLLSAALVLAAQSVAEEDAAVWQVAASGFKDTSRLVASNVEMMVDILLTNRAAVADMLARLEDQLQGLGRAVAAADEKALRAALEQARARRQTLYPPAG